MSAYEVTDKMVEAVKSAKYDMIILNFANCDMVGHTSCSRLQRLPLRLSIPASARSQQPSTRWAACCSSPPTTAMQTRWSMMTVNRLPHTTNPVPFCVVGYPCKLREGGVLADIAPTMLKIMDLPQPEEMTGKSIIL